MKKFIAALLTLLMLASTALGYHNLLPQLAHPAGAAGCLAKA
jgi:hypothetical protein